MTLKTLRDLVWWNGEDGAAFDSNDPRRNDKEFCKTADVGLLELRQEAIKWVQNTKATDLEELFRTDFGDDAWLTKIHIDDWIIHFFNLTKEDLK